MSKVYHLKFQQLIAADLETTWSYFTSPANLTKITPPGMDFKVISEASKAIYAGQIIEYKVKPLAGFSVYWMTEISHVENRKYFVDEQRFGPYSFWHHQHHFVQSGNQVLMTDIIHYKIPFWFFGDIANTLFVRKKLKNIFKYRFEVITKTFTGQSSPTSLSKIPPPPYH